jgi:hypothetical protein
MQAAGCDQARRFVERNGKQGPKNHTEAKPVEDQFRFGQSEAAFDNLGNHFPDDCN